MRLGRLLLITAFCGALGLTQNAPGLPAPKPPSPPLTSIADVLKLTNADADNHFPFHLRGQVTIFQPEVYRYFLQDGLSAIYFSPSDGTAVEKDLHPGDWVDAEGFTIGGLFSPVINVTKMRRVGHSALPAPLKVGESGQKVPEAGNVWAVAQGRFLRTGRSSKGNYEGLNFDLHFKSGESIPVRIGNFGNCPLDKLVDAEVSINGIASDIAYRSEEDHHSTALQVSDCNDIHVITPPPQDWSLPPIEIRQLLQYKSQTHIGSVVVVTGTVTLIRGNDAFFVQQADSGILVEVGVPGAIPLVGQTVQITGRIAPGSRGVKRLISARFRPAPKAVPVKIREATDSDFDHLILAGKLVRVRAEITSRYVSLGSIAFGLHVGKYIYTADLPVQSITTQADLPEVGDQVEVTGVPNTAWDFETKVNDVHIQLRSSADFQMVQKRPLLQRIPWGRVALLAGALSFVGFFFIYSLGNQVRARTNQLEIANREAEHARQQAELASRAKGEFLANMSHEIRTPMNGVLGMLELAQDTQLNQEQSDLIETAKSSANALLTLINDILDFSKIEAGKLDLDPIQFRLRDSIHRIMRQLAFRAEDKRLELLCNIHAGVPDEIFADPTRLTQVIINLVGNALKFTSAGEVELSVSVDSVQNDEAVLHFSVRDTGIGIPAEKQKSIFEAFAQVDAATTRKYGGTGLGLTISTRLVQLMGGKIWVESQPGSGTCFHFTIQALIVASKSEPEPLQSARLEGLHMLIVDDNASNRRILSEIVSAEGIRPVEAENAAIALQKLHDAAGTPAAIRLAMLDCYMPDVDGFALAEQIRKSEALSGVTILMLTSVGQRGDAARCRALGITAYLTKPISPFQLINALKMALAYNPDTVSPADLITRHSLPANPNELKILLAEDNPVNQKVARGMLLKLNHSVTIVGNGREAVAAHARETFDLILMDIQMPEMDGFQATAAIREKEKQSGIHTCIVALTAHAMSGDREHCLNMGMDGYITKPFRPQDLLSEITRLQTEGLIRAGLASTRT